MLNNISSKLNLQRIFANILNRRKLKILKYNKQLSNKLNITLEDFQNYHFLNEFDKNYNINIKEIDVTDLQLFLKNLGNKGLNDLSKIKFKELIELNLNKNNISDIKVLEKVEFNKLEKLYLNQNKIEDINVLEKVNFKNLKILYLNENKIKDINVLEKVNFKNLEILYLNENKISDITIFEKVIFPKLEKLYLNRNEIIDINILDKVNLKELRILDLSHNYISDIIVFEKVKFSKLEELNISKNCIDKDNYKSLISNLYDKIDDFIIDDDEDELEKAYYRYDCYNNDKYLELK